MGAGIRFVFGEAFDLYWKTKEGPQGPHWGLHTSYRVPKLVIGELSNAFSTSYAAPQLDLLEYFHDVDTTTNDDRLTWAIVGNTNPELVGPRVYGRSLLLHFPGARAGSAELTIKGTDQMGQSVVGVLVVKVAATVAGRYVFYNNSFFDEGNVAGNTADDGAIATDRSALLPGETATFSNYTSYSRGINGIMVDIARLPFPEMLDASHFQLHVGNSREISTWAPAAEPTAIEVRVGGGAGGSDRIALIWPDGAIRNQWLRVSVEADAVTGLDAPDVFYFGNSPGESGSSPMNTFVDGTDFAGARDNARDALNRAAIDFTYDYNRDSFVDALDLAVVRDCATNLFTALQLISVPDAVPAGPARGESSAQAPSDGKATDPAGVVGAYSSTAVRDDR